MKPQPLRTRTIGALRLGPQTRRDLARMLGCADESMRHVLDELAEVDSVHAHRVSRTTRTVGAPPLVWQLATGFCRTSRARAA